MNLKIAGIGPGSVEGITAEAEKALGEAELIVGYDLYVSLIKDMFPEKEYYTSGMRHEIERVEHAVKCAAAGKNTVLICSGDAGVYGMASLAFEIAEAYGLDSSEIEIIPGVTAALSCAAVLGSPLSCDFAVISLSDLLVPAERIKNRLICAAESGMPVVIYNPGSKKRNDYLNHACRIMLRFRPPETVCGIVKNAGRAGQRAEIMTLGRLADFRADMMTTVIIGCSDTRVIDGRMVTPRGYSSKYDLGAEGRNTEKDVYGRGRVLVFGGTSEGRIIASRISEKGYETWLSVATDYGKETAEVHLNGVKIISGKMPETEIEYLMRSRRFSCVIDATHPYAVHISKSIKTAAENTDTKLVTVKREVERGPSDESIMFFDTITDIIDYLNSTDGRVFFATGSNAAEEYSRLRNLSDRAAVRILPSADAVVRMKDAGFSSRNIICMQGPFSYEMNLACFRFSGAEYLVTKSSGETGGFDEKISAAEKLGMKVLVAAPPLQEDGISVDDVINMASEGRL